MDYYTKEESDFQHEKIMTTITAELQGMQSVMNARNAELTETLKGVATTQDITEMQATMDASMKDMKQFMKNVKIGFGVFEFSWNNSAKIGSLALIIFGIFIFFKVGIAGVIAAFFSPK